MTQQLTNRQLYMFREDIKEQTEKSDSFFYLHRKTLNTFWNTKSNKLLLAILDKNISQIQHRWCKKNDEGTFVFEGEEGKKSLQFETEENKAGYEKEIGEFFNLTVTIEL